MRDSIYIYEPDCSFYTLIMFFVWASISNFLRLIFLKMLNEKDIVPAEVSDLYIGCYVYTAKKG